LTNIEVKLKSIDKSSPYLYPSRTVEIRTRQGVMMTPLRAATFYEYRSKMKVPTATPIDNPALINIKKLTPTDLRNFLTTNESFGRLLRRIELSNRVGQYAYLRLMMLQPTTTTYEKEKPSSMQMLQDSTSLREKFLRFTIKIQQEARLDPITIPFLELPFNELRSMVVDVHRSLTKIDTEPMFFVDFRYESFQPLVQLLVDELQSKLIGLIYRRYSDYPIHYDFLTRYHDRDVAFFAIQTSRYDTNFDDISTMHYLPFFGNDVYAVKIPPPPFDDDLEREEAYRINRQRISRLQKIRFFDRASLKVKPLESGVLDTQRILADIRYQDYDIIQGMLENRDEVNVDNQKFLALNSFSKIHELNTSLLEFEDLRRYIAEGSAKDYVKEKSSLQPVLTQIEKKRTLNNYRPVSS